MMWLNDNLGLLTLVIILISVVTLFIIWISRPRYLKITRALYGRNGRYKNLTHILNDKIVENKLEVPLSNRLKGDPNEGVMKIAIIEYKYKDKKLKKEYIEGEIIKLP